MLCRTSFFVIFLLLSLGSNRYVSAQQAQSVLRVRVISDEGIGVPYANLVVTDVAAQARVLGVMASNEEGWASFVLTPSLSNVFIYVTAVGYEAYHQDFLVDPTQDILIRLKTSTIKLEEIKVKARVRTDTLLLDLDKMNLKKKTTLREILDKTPGMIVSKEGGVFFQGKQINKILINGKEVFLNQNKIALDNLNYEIMNQVEVIQNYKDRFNLDFNTIKESVININTKPEFKGVLKGEMEVGFGHRESYRGKGKGFYFSDKINAFATSYVNTVGKQELAVNEVVSPFSTYASNNLMNGLMPFFLEEKEARKNVIASHSLTLRQEGKLHKTGLVFYQGTMNMQRERSSRMYSADSLFRNYKSSYQERGNFLAALLEHNRRVSKRAVVQNSFGILSLNRRTEIFLADTLQKPVEQVFQQQMRVPLQDVVLRNTLKYTYLLSPAIALTLQGDFFREHARSDLKLQVLADDILQSINLTKQFVGVRSSLQFRLDKLTLNTGLNMGYMSDYGRLNVLEESMNVVSTLERKRLIVGVPIGLRFVKGKVEYDGRITSEVNHFSTGKNKVLWSTNQNLIYNFDAKDNLNLEVLRTNRFYELDMLFDTIVHDYNNKLINIGNRTNNFVTKEEASLSWFNTNAVRNISFRSKYSFSQEYNFRQNLLDSTRGHTLYYGNYSFSKRYTHTVLLNSSKFYYVGEDYHRLQFNGGLIFKQVRYPTLLDNIATNAQVNSWNPQLTVRFEPRNYFVGELKYSFNWFYNTYWMAKEKRMLQKEMQHRWFLEGNTHKIDWQVGFLYRQSKVNDNSIKVGDASLRFQYTWSDRLSLSLLGESLMSLFQLNSYNQVQIQVDGNMLTQVATDNNLGYLMLSAAVKF